MIKRLADNLKTIRKIRWRMSQDRFAQLLDSTRSKINSYENGGVEPSIAFILKLQRLSGASVHDLFYENLDANKVPPFPLENGQHAVADSGSQIVEQSELEQLIESQKYTQEKISNLESKLGEIRNLLRS